MSVSIGFKSSKNMKRLSACIFIFALLSSDYLARAQLTGSVTGSAGAGVTAGVTAKPPSVGGTGDLIGQVLSGGLLGNVLKLGALGDVLNLASKS